MPQKMIRQSDLLPEKGCCKSGCPCVSRGPSTWQVGKLQGNDDDDYSNNHDNNSNSNNY